MKLKVFMDEGWLDANKKLAKNELNDEKIIKFDKDIANKPNYNYIKYKLMKYNI